MPPLIPMVMPVILVWIVDIRVVATRVVAVGVIAIGVVDIRIGINISHLIPLSVGWDDTTH
jgi:hypothetical protein